MYNKQKHIDYMFAILKYIVSLFLMNLLKIAWILPVKKNDILFISFDGKQYSDNPKYISEYINSHEKNKNIIWAFILPQNYSYLYKNGYQIVSIHSIYFIFAILRAGTIITNCGIATYIPIRKNQTLLNTWHGGSPLKTVGLAEANHNQYTPFYFIIQNKKTSAYLSSSKFMTSEVFRRSFNYAGTILEYGMPRNAILLENHEWAVKKVYAHFGLHMSKDTALVLYAPTFRDYKKDSFFLPESQQFNIANCIKTLNTKFNKKFIFLFRAHHLILRGIPETENCIIASNYPDMQELLCAADVLITDYSSCMGDMALMQKPVFLYTPDLAEYIRDRGFYWDINTLPFPLAETEKKLEDAIINFCAYKYRIGVENYLQKLGSCESMHSIRNTVQWLRKRWNEKQ